MRSIRIGVVLAVIVGVLGVAAFVVPTASAATQQAFTWGSNTQGQLGNGSHSANDSCLTGSCDTSPEALSGMDVTQAYGGGDFQLAVQADGTVDAWGGNETGQLGMGNEGPTDTTDPTPIPGLDNVAAVAASIHSSIALNNDGTVDWWGNYNGGNQDSPVQEDGISTATAVSAGNDYNLALLSDGTVMGWGYNGFGELGDAVATGSTTFTATPIDGLSNVQAISAGESSGIALLNDGTVQTWGQNNDGSLGNGTVTGPDACENGPLTCDLTPTTVSGLPTIQAVSAGNGYDLALDTSGNVWAWGKTCATSCSNDGELGNGSDEGTSTPVELSGLPSISSLVAGQNFSMAIDGSGNVWTWGDNGSGQLGLGVTSGPDTCSGTEPCSMSPTQVSGLSNITVVSADGSPGLGAALAATKATHIPPTTTTTRPGCGFLPCPTITGFSPKKGAVGSTVTITGTNLEFGGTVEFGGDVTASYSRGSNTSATATVPVGAKTGILTLMVDGSHSAKSFKVKKAKKR